MTYKLDEFQDPQLNEDFVKWLTEQHTRDLARHFQRLWDYYQNPMTHLPNFPGNSAGESARNYTQAQEQGLAPRITGILHGADGVPRTDGQPIRKEVVIENDIAWRINAMVDFLFGKGVSLRSKAPDASRRRDIETMLNAVIDRSGGTCFFQDMAVLGSVYGFVDCAVRFDQDLSTSKNTAQTDDTTDSLHASSHNARTNLSFSRALRQSSRITLELIEAHRALPILEEDDYRTIRCYIQHFTRRQNSVDPSDPVTEPGTPARATMTEILGPRHWQRYENGTLIASGANPLGRIPVVHIQNIAQPYYYEGVSDVEQLIPLQDELNTRLSDRANRLTLQSFKMYLARGLESTDRRCVSPGHIWYTENTDASIDTFGGDDDTPSENLHISEIRDALDKVSGVSPVVAGLLRDKVGNLTSAVAIRMVFLGMLAKNTRKQYTYGRGIAQIAQLILECLDCLGIFATEPAERIVEVEFANPLPEDMTERLQQSQIKRELGVPPEQVLRELGYE